LAHTSVPITALQSYRIRLVGDCSAVDDQDVIVCEKAADKFVIRALPLSKLRSSLRGILLLSVAGVAGIGGGSWKNLQNPQRDYTKTNPPTE